MYGCHNRPGDGMIAAFGTSPCLSLLWVYVYTRMSVLHKLEIRAAITPLLTAKLLQKTTQTV